MSATSKKASNKYTVRKSPPTSAHLRIIPGSVVKVSWFTQVLVFIYVMYMCGC